MRSPVMHLGQPFGSVGPDCPESGRIALLVLSIADGQHRLSGVRGPKWLIPVEVTDQPGRVGRLLLEEELSRICKVLSRRGAACLASAD
jgi:hypothetical protein